MAALPAVAVDIQTSPQHVPSVPGWFAELTVLARHFAQRGILDAIGQHVQLARGRAGHYDVIDFVGLLLGYAVSGEPTLAAFLDRVAPFAQPFMALFGRDRLPHRSTLSRFLAAVDGPCLEALRHCFEADLCQHGFAGDTLGGLFDRHGQRVLIIDIDATRQAARQRALTTSPEYPPPHRRLGAACAPGYTGRKRGEIVRTRTTVLQAHTQQWLGTFSGAGNGDYGAELESACRVATAYLRAKGLSMTHALLRLDGLYGTASVLARIQHYGLGFLTRGRDYQVLDHPAVQARLQRPCDAELHHAETQVHREVFEVGYLTDWLEPLPGFELTCRVIVTRRVAPADPEEVSVGKLVGAYVYELFLTSHPAARLTATDIVELYHQRGAFEQVLSDEDVEQDPDRWCSHGPAGQEFWQIVNQWVWNTRLDLGQIGQDTPLRWTRWSAQPAAILPPPGVPADAAVPDPAPMEEEVVASYGSLEWAGEWARTRGRFSGQDFELLADGTLRCPAEKILRPRERRTLPNGDLRILYAAKQADCRACPLAPRCLGIGASGDTPRRVSAYRRLLGHHARPKQAPWQVPTLPDAADPGAPAAMHELHWCDLSGRRLRRGLRWHLRCQQVLVADADPSSDDPSASTPAPRIWTRAERAHRRLSWEARHRRNARSPSKPPCRVTLFGIAPSLAAYLGLSSTPEG